MTAFFGDWFGISLGFTQMSPQCLKEIYGGGCAGVLGVRRNRLRRMLFLKVGTALDFRD